MAEDAVGIAVAPVLRVHFATRAVQEPGWRHRGTGFEGHELWIALAGSGTVVISAPQAQILALNAGQMLHFSSESRFEVEQGAERLDLLQVRWSETPELGTVLPLRPQPADAAFVQSLAKRAAEAWAAEQHETVHMCWRLALSELRRAAAPVADSDNARLLDLADKASRDPAYFDFSVDRLAAEAGVSPDHFGRKFKTATGSTPGDWMVAARIRRAKHLLRDGSYSIADIAHLVGYADQASFTRQFKRVSGCTPGEWQRGIVE